jgi:phage recombination protein Bet
MSNIQTTGLTNAQLDLIKATVAKNATDDELALFLYRCKEMGLDPLKPGQIYWIKYGSNPGSIVIGIDGFRAKAAATGKHVGTSRGLTFDSNAALIGAWCEIYRSDWTHPAREEVLLSEYTTGKAMWAKMPATMLKKVAEVAALRIAFPEQLSGMYSHEEMDQAAEPVIVSQPKTVADMIHRQIEPPITRNVESATEPGQYMVQFGKYKGNALSDIHLDDLDNYVQFLKRKASSDNKPLTGKVLEFVQMAEKWMSAPSDGPHEGPFDDGAPMPDTEPDVLDIALEVAQSSKKMKFKVPEQFEDVPF